MRKSPRARRVRLRVLTNGSVEVVVPHRSRVTGLDSFVRGHADWIVRQQARFAEHEELRQSAGLARTGKATLNGRLVPVHRQGAAGRASARLEGGAFHVSATDDEHARLVLEAWYRKAAKLDLDARATHWAGVTGQTFSGMRIAGQKSLWGSCSPRGTLSFNWRLMMAPPAVRDYVVVHELCHRAEMNHSPAFWALVERHCPDYRLQRRWLRENGPAMVL